MGGDHPLAAQMLLRQPLPPLGVVPAQPAVFVLPAVVGLLGEAARPTGVEHGHACAGVELHRPQRLKHLFGRIPWLRQDPALSGCSPVSPAPWTKLARAGHYHLGWG